MKKTSKNKVTNIRQINFNKHLITEVQFLIIWNTSNININIIGRLASSFLVVGSRINYRNLTGG